MAIGQVIGYVLIVGVLIPWAGSRRRLWPCLFVVAVAATTTPLVAAGVCTLLGVVVEDWFGPLGVVWSAVIYAALTVNVWRNVPEVVTVAGLGRKLAYRVRRSMVGVNRRRAAVRDVRRAARGLATVEYRIEVE